NVALSVRREVHMSENTTTTTIIPVPRGGAVSVRPATAGDLAFIDGLQKVHAHGVGWMPTKQLEGKIKAGQVVVVLASRPWSSSSSEADMGETPMLPRA